MPGIGFARGTPDESRWEGPAYFEFTLAPDYAKTKTTRYLCRVGDRNFDFYAPIFMLRNIEPGDVPTRLLVAIARSPEPVQTLGFRSERRPLRLESDASEYERSPGTPVNSVRFDMVHDRQTYAIYVPKSIFGEQLPPERLWLQMGVPASET